jgi:DNA-binding transcriptional regulator YdaS (Cro superfamily)
MLDISQSNLADELGAGVDQPLVSMWENGTVALPPKRATEILRFISTHSQASKLPDGLTAEDLARPWDAVLLRLASSSQSPVGE